MSVNLSSVMGKVKAFSESPEGKKRMQDVIDRYKKEGISTTAAGSRIMTEETMLEAASKFLSVMRSTAADYDLPESVMDNFNNLGFSKPIRMSDGSYTVLVYFDDGFGGGLHRDSLQPDKYGGVDNIIAVLNNGYDRHDSMAKVWGVWHGARVHALTERTGLRFMQKAVSDFNGNYGYEYNVTASVGDAYA